MFCLLSAFVHGSIFFLIVELIFIIQIGNAPEFPFRSTKLYNSTLVWILKISDHIQTMLQEHWCLTALADLRSMTGA